MRCAPQALKQRDAIVEKTSQQAEQEREKAVAAAREATLREHKVRRVRGQSSWHAEMPLRTSCCAFASSRTYAVARVLRFVECRRRSRRCNARWKQSGLSCSTRTS